MLNRHAPRDAFISSLEDRLRGELARRPASAPAPRWMPQTARGLAIATAAIVVVSMAIGGGVVAAAYEAQQNQMRAMLVGTYEQRVSLAKQRVIVAQQQLGEAEKGTATGIAAPLASADARMKVTEAEAELRVTEIDLEEVRATGREPAKTVSAPLVSGRDFVSDRWRVEMSAKAAALENARQHAQSAKTRFNVGLANAGEVDEVGARAIEAEAAIQVAQQKIAIRQSFLHGSVSATGADLRVLEAETEQRRVALARRISFAERQLNDMRVRVEIGTLAPLDVAQAEVRLKELELDLKKADYDLALIRRQLGK